MNEIGVILKEARIEKGYTLDDLQQITKIQKRYLQAIEDGNLEVLPGRFYARAFIKQYADIVGLDGENLLEENLDQSSQEASVEFAESVNVPPARRTASKRSGFLSDFSEYLPTVLIFLLVAAILLVIYFAWRQMDTTDTGNSLINEENTEQVQPPVSEETNDTGETEDTAETEDTTADDTETEDAEEEEATEEEEEQVVDVASSAGAQTTYEISGTHPEEQTLELAAVGGDSWVSITVDGTTVEQGLISSGSSLTANFGADVNEVVLVIGNAAVTEIILNDSTIDYTEESAGIVRQDIILEFVE